MKNVPPLSPRQVALFEKKVDKSAKDVHSDGHPCWLWIGGTTGRNKGTFAVYPHGSFQAHVVSAAIAGRDIPADKDMDAVQSCGNTLCVQPEHVVFKRHSDRMRDVTNNKTTCINGHPRVPYKRCRTCVKSTRRACSKRYREKNPEKVKDLAYVSDTYEVALASGGRSIWVKDTDSLAILKERLSEARASQGSLCFSGSVSPSGLVDGVGFVDAVDILDIKRVRKGRQNPTVLSVPDRLIECRGSRHRDGGTFFQSRSMVKRQDGSLSCLSCAKKDSTKKYMSSLRAAVAKAKRSAADERKVKKRRKASREDLETRAKHLVASANSRAKKEGLEGTLTVDRVLRAFKAGVCEATGLPFVFDIKAVRSPWTPTLDRLNPASGYTDQGIQVVCWAYNAAKGTWTKDDVMRLAKAIVASESS